jgi:signal transduction histidine kinase
MTVYGGSVRTISEASPETPPARPQVLQTQAVPVIPAARPRPPLTKRLRPRQWAALDYLVGGIFGLILLATVRHGVVQAIENPYGFVIYRPLALTWPLAVFLIVMAVVAVGMRRRRPVFMLGILLAGSVLVTALTGPEVGTLAYFLPVAYVLYLVAATYEHRQAAVRVLIAVFATLLTNGVLIPATGGDIVPSGSAVPAALVVSIAWFTGYIVRQRRRYAVRLQDEAASKAVAEERLRIARELHDVVAHSMSVIAVQAGYGQYVIDTQPADARTALGAIQATSREALDEMRRMLGALRQADETDADRRAGADRRVDADRQDGAGRRDGGDRRDGAGRRDGGDRRDGAGRRDGGDHREIRDERGHRVDADATPPVLAAPLLPAPGLADLDRLVARTASAGVQVDVNRRGTPRELPASIDMSAYRIVQEALTNVVKHARTGSCRVLIGYGRDELVLEVTDNGAGLPAMALAGDAAPDFGPRDAIGGSGHGIIGMRERVSLLGGEFGAGPLPGYGFQVSAHIPLPQGND